MLALWMSLLACGDKEDPIIEDTGVQTVSEDCTDGVDNDTGAADGLIDCDDPDCTLDAACFEYTCDDVLDDDGDGLVDCADPDCEGEDACIELACDDNIDDDNDGLIDLSLIHI